MIVLQMKCPDEPEFVCIELEKIYMKLITDIEAANLLSGREIEVILTTNFFQDATEAAKEWGQNYQPTVEREYSASAYQITHPQNIRRHKIFIGVRGLPLSFLAPQFFHQIFRLESLDYLPDNWSVRVPYPPRTTKEAAELLLRGWVHTNFTWALLTHNKLLPPNAKDISIGDYFERFLIKVKQSHHSYQSSPTNRIGLLWTEFLSSLDSFIEYCIGLWYMGLELSGFAEFDSPINALIIAVHKVVTSILNKEPYSTDEVEKYFIEIAALCGLHIASTESNGIDILIKDNPHFLFQGKIKETEQRIVAFIDILGFKKHIEEHENNPRSTVLRRLNKALEDALEKAQKLTLRGADSGEEGLTNYYKDAAQLLETRVFSDCVMFSMPYFDSDKDFTIQCAYLLTVVRIFQAKMLLHEFCVRGGIAVGTYYADETMIFSGGLVKAYHLETRAVMPRIVLDDRIAKRLAAQSYVFLHMLGIQDALLQEQNNTSIFLNPFNATSRIPLKLDQGITGIKGLFENLGLNTNDTNYKTLFDFIEAVQPLVPTDLLSTPLESISELESLIVSTEELRAIQLCIKSEITKAKNELNNEVSVKARKELRKIARKYRWLLSLIKWVNAKPQTRIAQKFSFFLAQ